MNLTTTRSSHSGIFQNVSYGEQIRSVIDIWRNEGYMPDGRSSNYNGRRQGGSNADNILGDAYVKGIRDAVNWTAGYGKDAQRRQSAASQHPRPASSRLVCKREQQRSPRLADV
jgi:putative alpha-1,2-mannosidase